ncbi:MAG: methyltetrahydrofolate--corrinoid methyltransferase [Spirochaetales bacterium]|nr:MAG: methyltetrahydrofolate--corrinoid methyltransferase [Spirochaetales bacterium]
MKLIGEKINGTLLPVRRAIENRDSRFIRELAKLQAEAGADWLDVNAGTSPEKELDDLVWLINCIQDEVDTPLCIDSANPGPLAAAVDRVKVTPMINSISLEPQKLEGILPIVVKTECEVIALAMDENGIPRSLDERLTVIHKLVSATRSSGIPDSKVYIDPLVMAASTNTDNGKIVLDTIRIIHEEFPEIHFCGGVSNISFGLPHRTLVNQAFLSLAINAGLDCAILDPLNRDIRAAILSVELVLGMDKHCQRYSRASKKGLIGRQTDKNA